MGISGDPNIESVLAGTRTFVAAILPAVKSRAGAEPRVAADPRQAFTYCAESGGLLVLEYAGPEWLPLVRDLRSLCGDAISVVVAVNRERMDAVTGLQRAGADEVVAWDGRADSVAWAVERILASRGRERSPEPGPAALEPPVQGYAAPAPAPPVLRRAAAPPGAAPQPGDGPSPSPLPAQWPGAVAPSPAAAGPGEPAPGATSASPGTPPPEPAPPAAFTIREVAAAPPAPPAAAPGPAAASGAWPAGVLAGPDAERLLAAVVTGAASEPGPARAVAVQTAQGLSDLERRALADIAVPVDGALFRRASALRLRVALALGSAPAPGTMVDSAAVQSLLAELDSVLAELKGAAEAADAEHHPALGALRSALVKEAIDLTDAVHRIAPAQAPAIPTVQARAPATRLLSNRAAGAAPEERQPVRRGWLILLVLAAAAAGAFHGYNFLTRKPLVPPPTFGGAPQGAIGVRQGQVSVVVPEAGRALDPKQVESFKAQEEAKGNVVKEVAPGTYVSVPATAVEGGKKP